MKMSAVIEGLQILQQYYAEDTFSVGADHDVIYVYPTDRPLSTAHVDRLLELDWIQWRESNGWMAYV